MSIDQGCWQKKAAVGEGKGALWVWTPPEAMKFSKSRFGRRQWGGVLEGRAGSPLPTSYETWRSAENSTSEIGLKHIFGIEEPRKTQLVNSTSINSTSIA